MAQPIPVGVDYDPFLMHSGMDQGARKSDMVGLDNDPFLSHSGVAPRKQGEAPQVTQQQQQPPVPVGPVGVDADPFLTHTRGMVQKPKRDWNRTLFNLFGPGDPDRKERELRTMSILPWLLYVWTLLLWLMMRHYSYASVVIIMVGCATVAGVGILAWYRGIMKSSTPPIGPFAALCLLALALGAGSGIVGWHYVWRELWWVNTGETFFGTAASSPAMSRVDAAVISFLSETTSGSKVAGTAVDNYRSAGYRDDFKIFCAAPVLDPVSVASGLARVNYWAIGIDCCDDVGAFTCDDSRSQLGGYGVVMLDGGYPCPGCNNDKFAAAVKKAEALHGLVSARGAHLLRWVADPASVRRVMSVRAIIYVLGACLLAFPLIASVGGLAWYKGLGKPTVYRKEDVFLHLPAQQMHTVQTG